MIYSEIVLTLTIAALTLTFSLGLYDLFSDIKKYYFENEFNAIISDIIFLVIIIVLVLILVIFTRNNSSTKKFIQSVKS
jgi:hypothetical protein